MSSPSLILGVDPGLSGALALYDPAAYAVVEVIDMPVHEIRGRKKIDLYQLGAWVDGWAASVKAAWIEDVGPMPKDGPVQAFRFGYATGAVNGAVSANLIPIHYVRPNVWKRAMALTRDKDDSRRKASHLFPKSASLFARVKDDGRAEALLLAVYGARVLERKLG